jgi:hypothetical protein
MENYSFKQHVDIAIQAIITCLNPLSTKENRLSAENFLSSLKSKDGVNICLFILSDPSYSLDVYILTFSILNNAIKHQYSSYTSSEQVELRNQLFSLFLQTSSSQIVSAPALDPQHSSKLLTNKVIRIKIAVILSYIVEQQYPSLWSSCIEDMIALWMNTSSIQVQIILIAILETILVDCIDTDYNSQLTTSQKREILSGIKSHAYRLLSTTMQYYLFCQHQFLSNNMNRIFEDALNQCLRLLSPLISHLKPFHHVAVNEEVLSRTNPQLMNEDWNQLNETILESVLKSLSTPCLMKSALEVFQAIIGNEKYDLTVIITLIKSILCHPLIDNQAHSHILAVFADDPSNQIFYSSLYTSSLYKLISNNIRELYNDNQRNRQLVAGNQQNYELFLQYFQLLVQCLHLPIVSYRLAGELINDWIKIIKDYPETLTTTPAIELVSSQVFPWMKELVPIIMRFYQQKAQYMIWSDDDDSSILSIEFEDNDEYRDFYATFKSQVRGFYATIASKFSHVSLEMIRQGFESLYANDSEYSVAVTNSQHPVIHAWNAYVHMYDAVIETIFSSTATGVQMESYSLIYPMITAIHQLLASSQQQNIFLLIPKMRLLTSCGIILKAYHQHQLDLNWKVAEILYQFFTQLALCYRLQCVSYPSSSGLTTATSQTVIQDTLSTIIGSAAQVIESLANSCAMIILEAAIFPIQSLIQALCELLNLTSVSNLAVPIYAKASLRDALVILADRLSNEHMVEKTQLLTIALGSVVQSFHSYSISDPAVQISSLTPAQIFSNAPERCVEIFYLSSSGQSIACQELVQEVHGVLRYLISSAKRVAVYPESYSLTCQEIRAVYPYLDVWIASTPIFFEMMTVIHHLWSRAYRRSIQQTDGNSYRMMIYIPSLSELAEALPHSDTSEELSQLASGDTHYQLRHQLKTLRQFLYQFYEKILIHRIFLIQDLTFASSAYPRLSDFMLVVVEQWLVDMEYEHLNLFFKHVFDHYVVYMSLSSSDIGQTSYEYHQYVLYRIIQHMNHRIQLAYSSSNSSISSEEDYRLYHQLHIPAASYYASVSASQTGGVRGLLSVENLELARMNLISNTMKVYVDSLMILTACKGPLHLLLPSASSASAPVEGQQQQQSHQESIMRRKFYNHQLLLSSRAYPPSSSTILDEYLTSLSLLMKITSMEIVKKAMLLLMEMLFPYLLPSQHNQTNEYMLAIDPVAYSKILAFLSQEIFSIGCYLLLRNAPWSVGLEWDLIAMLSQLYWVIVLGQSPSSEDGSASVNSMGQVLSLAPREILLRIGYVTAEEIERLDREMLASSTKKQRREIFRDFLMNIYHQHRNIRALTDPANAGTAKEDGNQQLATGSILETSTKKNGASRENHDENLMMDLSSMNKKKVSANIVELGDCDLSRIFTV